MKRSTAADITKFINDRVVLVDDIGPFIPMSETKRIMRDLMSVFEEIYCGTTPDKHAGQVFFVRSDKTGKVFFKSRVK